MAVCKYCNGMGCINKCKEEKMKNLKLIKTVGDTHVDDLAKVERIAEGKSGWGRSAHIDVVQSKNGELYLSFDDSEGEYGPVAVSLQDLQKVLNKY
jgi:hypothetical protein